MSFVWTLLSLPIVTVGPVTLGAYRGIILLRENGHLDLDDVWSTVRENLLTSILFGVLPLTFGGIGLLYLLSPIGGFGSLSVALGVAALYIGLYLAVLLIPTFYRMASGDEPMSALRTGYLCIARDPITAVRIVLVTVMLFIVAALLTIALIVIFPSFTMTYHIHVIERRLTGSDGS